MDGSYPFEEQSFSKVGSQKKDDVTKHNKLARANIYMLFAGWEVRIVKNCDRGLEKAARGHRPRATFSSPRSHF